MKYNDENSMVIGVTDEELDPLSEKAMAVEEEKRIEAADRKYHAMKEDGF